MLKYTIHEYDMTYTSIQFYRGVKMYNKDQDQRVFPLLPFVLGAALSPYFYGYPYYNHYYPYYGHGPYGYGYGYGSPYGYYY
jgi:hypothetical protein